MLKIKIFYINFYILTFLSIISICLTGCEKLNYDEADISDTFSQELPNTILVNFYQVVVENKLPAYLLTADKAENYNDLGTTYFSNVLFIEFDDNGVAGTEGAADSAVYYNNSDDIVFNGNLIINAIQQDFIVRSSYLEWDNEKRIMKGLDNSKVTIQQGDGAYIEGTGFIGDAATKSFTFLEKTQGRYNDEKDN